MILLQLSAGQGPEECARAVALAWRKLETEAATRQVAINLLEAVPTSQSGCYKSVLAALQGEQATRLATEWQGVMQWICPSPFRAGHKRKNWFFSGQVFHINEQSFTDEIRYQSCKASGAGGQHVNTTDSAVRATHVSSGISVRVESERSQHSNKRLARTLILHKLEEMHRQSKTRQEKERWTQHQNLQRGNPQKAFTGVTFRQLTS